jgi:hypothetical protein
MNDVDVRPVTALHVEQYMDLARDVAARALSSAEVRAAHFPCLADVTATAEASCARDIIEGFGSRAYRRPLDAETIDELVQLQADLRGNGSFEESIASLLEAMLQAPDFLYRLEFGFDDPALDGGVRRPTGHEMATRLSYLLWGTMPDDGLQAAAAAGELDTAPGVLARATSMLDDRRSRPVLRHFFDAFLGLGALEVVDPDPELFPTFSSSLPELMHEETLGFLEQEILEGSGSWRSVLTVPRVYVNDELAAFYGIDGVEGAEFRMVEVDPEASHRFGLLTQGSLLTSTSLSTATNPFRRGHLIVVKLMCEELPPPPVDLGNLAVPPSRDSVATTRELWEQSTLAEPACAACHRITDPVGFALENYDAAGLWREQENGVPIDASASTDLLGDFVGPMELVAKVAGHEQTYSCLVDNWARFGYGRALDESDGCAMAQLQRAFAQSGYDVKALVLASTQTDAFLYLPAVEGLP